MVGALLVVVLLIGLAAWSGYRAFESSRAEDQRNLFLQVGRQVALNLSTIDARNADTNVRRILDPTGTFHDDFQQRSQAFVELVRQAQSKSEGAVTEAGLESQQGNVARVPVALTVKTVTPGTPGGPPRSWRMRIHLQDDGVGTKASNVEFVP
ncbi:MULTISPECIES: mammalian cell entry protein [Mycolicibacterium]|uniref:Mce associated membrane protein n=2 Tax=Mycolicibacterium TaxID=1866885 RepID=A0AAD1H5S9_9MYCO|nr:MULTISPECIES: mammalian cell entry protein [Mycolicibacterium]MCV7042451.1 hypothetical protein [Mycolicibacterium moriokaense]MCV7058226.1 hypothetical protein [Mycolicibacterium gilvum]ORB22953.1 mammalian cell entry protein [Mycolicibacterium moriokaense]STZ41146.1 Uncharacterized protein conserved in bacteria (DUF2133) [Mycolicibacterium gilvum]BBW99124.1 Mce associated membrane protein [Mycolicibacterium moriokaense]